MGASSKPSDKQRRDSIELEFMKIFRIVKRRLRFAPVSVDSLEHRMLDVLVQAAVSRCIEFNIAANRIGTRAKEAFFLLSNLRGICEDLIYLTYLCKMEEKRAKELIRILVRKNTLEGLAVQRRFFDANNPLQPVLGKEMSVAKTHKATCREEFRQFWKSVGNTKRDGPNMFDMANDVGLISTYEFIYFSASNFVHFNPQVLLRTGWNKKNGPFAFSTQHMHTYYQSFSSFYGAVLFIGFQASFGSGYFKSSVDIEIERLIELIGHVQRWPEIVTFEEMNVTPPLYFLTHALGRVVREDDETVPYGAILREVQALKRSGGSP